MNTVSSQAEKIKEISGVNPLKCMKCGKCSASCPAFDEMDIKPHQFVSYVQNENIEALVQSESLWKCETRKTDRCSKTAGDSSAWTELSDRR